MINLKKKKLTEVIAEIGWNHMGDMNLAESMIKSASESGATYAKFQTWSTKRLKRGEWDHDGRREIYEKAELSIDDHIFLIKKCQDYGIKFLSSCFSLEDAQILKSLGQKEIKIPSMEVRNHELLKYCVEFFDHLYISTGTADESDLIKLKKLLYKGTHTIMHCVSSYPAPVSQSNVKTIQHLADTFGVVAGLSDHTLSNAASIASIAIGGSVIEKHFTLRRADGGPDAAFSLEPDEFTRLAVECKDAWYSLGKVDYSLKEAEKQNLKFRRSVYFMNNIKKGSVVNAEDVRVIRPGFGLPPVDIDKIIGRRLKVNVSRGQATKWEYFE